VTSRTVPKNVPKIALTMCDVVSSEPVERRITLLTRMCGWWKEADYGNDNTATRDGDGRNRVRSLKRES
jgi:hypothetical protein